ncbi:MAG: hypothetical protein KC620_21970, partial [Myxococcales bacterium]|nr:hypothetical protein [Myxococcales bacterium]
MSTGQTIHKARLIEMSADFANEKPGGRRITVQFNPDSLKVNFANQIQTPTSTGDQSGTSNKLYVGSGNTKLQLQLWFDVNQPQPGEQRFDDVRKLTEQVAWFITPQPDGNKFVPPAVRFEWGTFLFDGVMDSLDETLEFFSSDGRPLRASVSLGMSRQEISAFKFGTAGARGVSPAGNAPPGTRPLAE